jgi:ABC-type multidrug transport system ATPase subunit
MIETKKLVLRKNDLSLNGIDLSIKDGEIYLLMCQRKQSAMVVRDSLAGYRTIQEGDVLLDSQIVTKLRQRPITIVNRIENTDDFEPDLRLNDILELNCREGLKKNESLEILLNFDLIGDHLNKKVRHCSLAEFKAFYLSLLLAKDNTNIIINDFIRGEEKSFELKFNRLLQQLKEKGKAILYLTGDIFYAYSIADRVSFLKNGNLVPKEPIVSKDFEELDAMDVYRKYLS